MKEKVEMKNCGWYGFRKLQRGWWRKCGNIWIVWNTEAKCCYRNNAGWINCTVSSGGSALPQIWLKNSSADILQWRESSEQSKLAPDPVLCIFHWTTVIIEQKICNFKAFPGDAVGWTSLLLVAVVLCSLLVTTFRPWVCYGPLGFVLLFFSVSASLLLSWVIS